MRGLLVPGRCAENATTMAWTGPQPHRCCAEPVAYLTVGDVAQPAAFGGRAPADEAVPGGNAERGRSETDERDPLVFDRGYVAQHPAEEVVPQEVVLVEQSVEPGDLVGAHEPHGQLSS